jgi:hypothetical protein
MQEEWHALNSRQKERLVHKPRGKREDASFWANSKIQMWLIETKSKTGT